MLGLHGFVISQSFSSSDKLLSVARLNHFYLQMEWALLAQTGFVVPVVILVVELVV